MAERVLRTLTCDEADDLAAAFVLGALEDDDPVAVREHLAGCANDHAAFDELGAITPALLESAEPVEPRAELGDRIMAAARAERAERIADAWQAPRVQSTAPQAGVPAKRPNYVWVALAAAAAIVIGALGFWNFQLRGQVDELTAYRQAVAGIVDRAASGGQVAVLKGQGVTTSQPSGLAAVGTDGSVAVAMRDLAPTLGTEVYTVWLIGTDQTPLAVGEFTVGGDRVGGTITSVGKNETGVTIALTREPRPGMTAPTLPIVALGTAQASGG